MGRKFLLVVVSFLIFALSPVAADEDTVAEGVDIEQNWAEEDLPYRQLALEGDYLIASASWGNIEIYNADTGEWIADDDSSGDSREELAVEDGVIYSFDDGELKSAVIDEQLDLEEPLREGFEYGWSQDIGFTGSLSIYGERIAVSSEDKVGMYDENGGIVWSVDDTEHERVTEVANSEETVFSGDYRGKLTAIDQNGVQWTEQLDGWLSLEYDRDTESVYVGSEGKVTQYDKYDGSELWSYELGDYFSGEEVRGIEVVNNSVIVAMSSGNVININKTNNEKEWSFIDTGDENSYTDIKLDNGSIFLSDRRGILYSYSHEENGEEIKAPDAGIEVEDSEGKVFRLGAETESEVEVGRVEWSFEDGSETGENVVRELQEGENAVEITFYDILGNSDTAEITLEPEHDLGIPDVSVDAGEEFIEDEETSVNVEIREEGVYGLEIESDVGFHVSEPSSGWADRFSDWIGTDEEVQSFSQVIDDEGELELMVEPKDSVNANEADQPETFDIRVYALEQEWQDIFEVMGQEGDLIVSEREGIDILPEPGTSPNVEVEGNDLVKPELDEDGDLIWPTSEYSFDVETDPDTAEIVDYDWDLVGILDEREPDLQDGGFEIDWSDHPTLAGHLPAIDYSLTDENFRSSEEERFIIEVEDIGLDGISSPELGGTAEVNVTVTEEVIEDGGYHVSVVLFARDGNGTVYSQDKEITSGDTDRTFEFDIPDEEGIYNVRLTDKQVGDGGPRIDEGIFVAGDIDNLPTGDANLQLDLHKDNVKVPDDGAEQNVRFNVENTGDFGTDRVSLRIDDRTVSSTVIELQEGESKVESLGLSAAVAGSIIQGEELEEGESFSFTLESPDDIEHGSADVLPQSEVEINDPVEDDEEAGGDSGGTGLIDRSYSDIRQTTEDINSFEDKCDEQTDLSRENHDNFGQHCAEDYVIPNYFEASSPGDNTELADDFCSIAADQSSEENQLKTNYDADQMRCVDE